MRTRVNQSVNDVVIIYEDKAPRKKWRLGKIISVIPSKDVHIRAAQVGKTRRIINRAFVAVVTGFVVVATVVVAVLHVIAVGVFRVFSVLLTVNFVS